MKKFCLVIYYQRSKWFGPKPSLIFFKGIAYVSEEIETVKEEDDDTAFEDVSLDENDEISNSSSHAENPIQNRFSFLRKKSVMIRKKSGNPPPPSYRSLYMEKDELS